MDVRDDRIESAAETIRDGGLVIYPTETVYGLAADALDPAAIVRAFDVKGRPRENPLSLAVGDLERATAYIRPDERTLAFMEAFLPGPVTVVCEKDPVVPDELTGGRDRVGVRVPDHPVALALLDRVAPITATSANRSGEPSARRIGDIDSSVREAALVLEGGETPGGESTVVDVATARIHRRGARADAVETWLSEHR